MSTNLCAKLLLPYSYVAFSVQSDDNNNKYYKTKKDLEIKFKKSFSINAFNSTITKAKNK